MTIRVCACGAEFLTEGKRRSCSRSCAARAAHQARPTRPPRPRYLDDKNHRLVLRLLDSQPLERCPRGGWRFGAKRISDDMVARLVASGRAEIRGEQVHRTEARP